MELKINFINQVKMLPDLFFISVVYFFVIFFCYQSFDFKIVIYLLVPYLLVYFFPVFFLHLNYWICNKESLFVVSEDTISLKKKNTNYHSSDIDEIILYKNGARETKVGILAHKEYYYAKIKLLDQSSLIITSLCSSTIDKILQENFPNIKIRTEKVFYPMITQDEL